MDLPTAARAACALLLVALLGCTSASEPAPPRVAHAQPQHTHAEGKLQAPVELKLDTSGTAQALTATLTFTAKAPIQRATARFVPPAGARVLQGKLEVDLGPLSQGETRQIAVLLSMDDLSGELAAGVDAQLNQSSRLHKGTVVTLGSGARVDPTRRVQMPEGDRARTQTLK